MLYYVSAGGGGWKIFKIFAVSAAAAEKFLNFLPLWRRRLYFFRKNRRRRRLSRTAYTSTLEGSL